MKRTAIIAGAALLMLATTVNAQTDSTRTPARDSVKAATGDKYNNWNADTYKMQPMPDALTQDKIFPAIGRYQVTDKDGAQSEVTVTLDETNKGMVWIDGLPQGRVKGILRKSPATYKIPAQTIGDDKEAKDAKKVAEGVLIFDKDANVLNICFGCTYNVEDPASAFAPPAEPVMDESAATAKKTTKKAPVKSKIVKAKPIHYSGTKVIEQTATVAPAAPQQ